jgi:hypothetical protein
MRRPSQKQVYETAEFMDLSSAWSLSQADRGN